MCENEINQTPECLTASLGTSGNFRTDNSFIDTVCIHEQGIVVDTSSSRSCEAVGLGELVPACVSKDPIVKETINVQVNTEIQATSVGFFWQSFLIRTFDPLESINVFFSGAPCSITGTLRLDIFEGFGIGGTFIRSITFSNLVSGWNKFLVGEPIAVESYRSYTFQLSCAGDEGMPILLDEGNPYANGVVRSGWSENNNNYDTMFTISQIDLVCVSPLTEQPQQGLGLGGLIGIILGSVCAVFLVIIIIVLALIRVRRKNSSQKQVPIETEMKKSKAKQDITNIPFFDLQIKSKLGEGSFGEVYRGTWNGADVALKKLKNTELFDEFQREAIKLNSLNHPNIVRFLGVSKSENESYLVTGNFF